MALNFIDLKDRGPTGKPVVRSNSENEFRSNYQKANNTLTGVDDSYRQSKRWRTYRENMGIDRAGQGPMVERISAPSPSQLNTALQAEQVQLERDVRRPMNQYIPMQPGVDNGNLYANLNDQIGTLIR